MKVYVKSKIRKRWHWVLECPKYPEGNKLDVSYKNPGDKLLCQLCRQIEAEGKTRSKFREILDDGRLH